MQARSRVHAPGEAPSFTFELRPVIIAEKDSSWEVDHTLGYDKELTSYLPRFCLAALEKTQKEGLQGFHMLIRCHSDFKFTGFKGDALHVIASLLTRKPCG